MHEDEIPSAGRDAPLARYSAAGTAPGADITSSDNVRRVLRHYAQHFPAPAFGVDQHSTYLRDWLGQAGVTEIDELRFQPTLLTADPAGDLEAAKRAAAELAHRHGKV